MRVEDSLLRIYLGRLFDASAGQWYSAPIFVRNWRRVYSNETTSLAGIRSSRFGCDHFPRVNLSHLAVAMAGMDGE